jgi:hypothetical protein
MVTKVVVPIKWLRRACLLELLYSTLDTGSTRMPLCSWLARVVKQSVSFLETQQVIESTQAWVLQSDNFLARMMWSADSGPLRCLVEHSQSQKHLQTSDLQLTLPLRLLLVC